MGRLLEDFFECWGETPEPASGADVCGTVGEQMLEPAFRASPPKTRCSLVLVGVPLLSACGSRHFAPPEGRHQREMMALEHTPNPAPPAQLDATANLRRQYFEAADVVISELKRRFVQPGLKRLSDMEELLLGEEVPSVSDITERLNAIPESDTTASRGAPDIDAQKLHSQLEVLRSGGYRSRKAATVRELSTSLFGGPEGKVRAEFLGEVVKLCRLVLTVPVSVATGERTFSALRHVKTHTRSTMSQARLCHLMLLNVHQELALDLDLRAIMREFVNRHPRKRVPVFGRQ